MISLIYWESNGVMGDLRFFGNQSSMKTLPTKLIFFLTKWQYVRSKKDARCWIGTCRLLTIVILAIARKSKHIEVVLSMYSSPILRSYPIKLNILLRIYFARE